ncbi:S1C family serine protease, partial [Thermoflexus sp.]|uniref:S1C family serine protease n=1 Tax=Thermoflexus sp. TaxID=1969742 RepID=UPI002ADD5A37
MRRSIWWILAGIVLFVGGCAVITASALLWARSALTHPSGEATLPPSGGTTAPSPTPTPIPPGVLSEARALEAAFISVYQRVSPSVVHITTRATAFDLFRGPVYQEGTGSGFVWDTEGHIVTNNHVVEGADQIEVILADGTTASATLVGADAYNDLAVLRIRVPREKLIPVMLGDSSRLQVGQWVIAIGNPFGLD